VCVMWCVFLSFRKLGERASAITGTDNSATTKRQVCGKCRSVPVRRQLSGVFATSRRQQNSSARTAASERHSREAVGGTTIVVTTDQLPLISFMII